MRKSLEEKWVSLIDSKKYREFAQRSVVSKVFKSSIYQSTNYFRRYAITYYKANRFPKYFQEVEKYCIFIGQTKSGSSMIGGLLDAHPNIIISDEANALQYVETGLKRDQLFHILLRNSKRELMKGRVTARRLTPYSFLVPDQWQGNYSKLIAIGDSTAAKTTQNLAANPELIRDLEVLMNGIQVKVIQVIRNPFDPISIMMIRGKRTFDNAMNHYFKDCKTLVDVRKELNTDNLYSIRYEDFVKSPAAELSNLCKFLGLVVTDEYLDGCTSILSETPDQSRHLVKWKQDWIENVHDKILQFDYLAGYTFSN